MISREETLQNELFAWVESGDGYAFLLKISSSLINEVEHNGVLATVWPYPPTTGVDSKKDTVEEVAHDFYIFLMASFVPQLPKHPDHIHLLESGNYRKLFEHARKKFLW